MYTARGCDRYDDMLKDRASGMTYAQIGRKYGVTRQRIGQICGKYNKYNFRVVKDNGCVYKNLRKWMNENSVGRAELLRKIGVAPEDINEHTLRAFRRILTGKSEMSEEVAGRLAAITGMRYEVILESDEEA